MSSRQQPNAKDRTMSMVTMACPVCGEIYTIGVVGSGVVGGHVCPVKTERDVLRTALAAMVDLYRHPDSGEVLVEAGHSEADDALIVALEALGDD